MCYSTLIILKVEPWWQPQYIIPILGMVLGNTISGISVGLAAIIEELSAGNEGGRGDLGFMGGGKKS